MCVNLVSARRTALVSDCRVTWDFPKTRVPYFGVLIIRILWYCIRVPYFGKPPHDSSGNGDFG